MPINRAFVALLLCFCKFDIGKEITFFKKIYFPITYHCKKEGQDGLTIKSQGVPIAVWYKEKISGFYVRNLSISTVTMAVWGLPFKREPDKNS